MASLKLFFPFQYSPYSDQRTEPVWARLVYDHFLHDPCWLSTAWRETVPKPFFSSMGSIALWTGCIVYSSSWTSLHIDSTYWFLGNTYWRCEITRWDGSAQFSTIHFPHGGAHEASPCVRYREPLTVRRPKAQARTSPVSMITSNGLRRLWIAKARSLKRSTKCLSSYGQSRIPVSRTCLRWPRL